MRSSVTKSKSVVASALAMEGPRSTAAARIAVIAFACVARKRAIARAYHRRHRERGGVMTPESFSRGMTFDDYVKFTGSPENLAREGFDLRRFSSVRPRVDWSQYLRDRHARAQLTGEQTAAIRWLAAQPGGPAKLLVLSEDWSSDCRPDVPYLARLAE